MAVDLDLPSDADFLAIFDAPINAPDRLLEALRATASLGPIAGLRDFSATSALLEGFAPDAVITEAEAILQGEIRFFGGQRYHFGNPIDWHLEPVAGRVVPRAHWSRIAYLDPAVAGDKKIIWELNRQQYLLTLGRAFVRTRDERYADAFVEHVQAWMADNPPKRGINWASALEVSYRTIAWLWALMLFRSSRAVTPSFACRMLKHIRLNARHIETYLSTYFSPNTHLTGEALGLYYVGSLLPFLPDADRWRQKGRAILLEQLPKQVRRDGIYFENAFYYHRYCVDIYVHFAVMATARGEPLDDASMARIEALSLSLAALIKPDGTHGLFGDDDGGRLLPMDEAAANDFRPALGNAAVLLGRKDLRAVAGQPAEEAVWLFGARALLEPAGREDANPAAQSRAFADSGFVVMRDGAARDANHLVIDCGPHGAMNCGHAHADALAFELVAHGRSILMDAGTFTYSGSATLRREFRSTAFHNAFTVDGASSSDSAGPFNWNSIAHSRLIAWRSSELCDFFEGEHDGFGRLSQPTTYRRSVLFIKNGYWVLRDRAASAGPHRYAQHFLFAAGASPHLTSGGIDEPSACREEKPDAPGLDLVTFSERGSWSLQESWVSTCYNVRQPTRMAVFSATGASTIDFITFMLPRLPGSCRLVPRATPITGGRAFTLPFAEDAAGVDLFLVRDGDAMQASGVSSDAAWIWLRRRDGTLDAMAAQAAKSIEIDGEPLFQSSAACSVTVSHEDGDMLLDVEGAPASFDFTPRRDCAVRYAGSRLILAINATLRVENGIPAAVDATSNP